MVWRLTFAEFEVCDEDAKTIRAINGKERVQSKAQVNEYNEQRGSMEKG